MVGMRQIAERCGVSIATVSAALNGREQGVRRDARERAQRIRATAAELGYRPQAAARALRTRRSGAVGLLTMNHRGTGGALSHPNQYELVLGATQALASSGLGAVLIPMDGLVEPGGHRAFQQRMLDGVIASGECSSDARRRAEALGVPLVWADANRWAAVGCLRRDERAAGRAAAELARAAGYRRLVLLGRAHAAWWAVERRAGLAAVGLPLLELDVDGDRPGAWDALTAGLDGRSAVVALTAYQAEWLVAAAAAAGSRLGSTLPCVACEDDAHLARACPGLSRVRFDRHRLGRAAAAMLERWLATDAAPPSRRLVDETSPGATLPPP